MRTFKIVSISIVYLFVTFLLCFNLNYVFCSVTGGKLPSFLGLSFVSMNGPNDMGFGGDDVLIVKRGNVRNFKVGEVIVFDYGDNVAVSKIMSLLDGGDEHFGGSSDKGGYVTKNADTNTANAAVGYSDVYGKVIGAWGHLGSVFNYFSSWEFNFFLATILVIIVWLHIIFLSRKIKGQEVRIERMNESVKYLDDMDSEPNEK